MEIQQYWKVPTMLTIRRPIGRTLVVLGVAVAAALAAPAIAAADTTLGPSPLARVR
jgi:hypothetical protein